MKKLLMIVFLCVMAMGVKAQDASITEFFGAELKFYAQQFNGQQFLIVKFQASDDCIPLNETAIRVKFMDGTEALWEGYCVTSWINSKTEKAVLTHEIKTTEKTVNVMRFDLKDEDVESLNKGIAKIAIYTVPKVFRKEYKVDKLGQKLYKAFAASSGLF